MKKIGTLLITLLLFSLHIQAQSLIISEGELDDTNPTTDPIMVSGSHDNYELVAHATLKNATEQDYTIKWERTVVELSGSDSEGNDWQSLICDPVQCWDPPVSTNTFDLPAGAIARMDAHFQSSPLTPDLGSGHGMVEVHVWAVEDSANVNTTIVYEAQTWTVGIEEEQKKELRVYPNPFVNELNIDLNPTDKIVHVEVFNLIGKQMSNCYMSESENGFIIDTADYEEGLYFICFYNDQQEMVISRVVSKMY